jgi:hypothetical protein
MIVSLPAPALWSSLGPQVDNTNVVMNSAGQTSFIVGHVYFPAQAGSKTISSAGGVLYLNTSASVVFADGSTNLRAGVQDVDTSGINDGTFDVYADCVGGVFSLGSNACVAVPMASGTKTIGFMDLVAIGVTLTARAGSDLVTIRRAVAAGAFANGLPYGITNGSRAATVPLHMLKFDDGTYGWILAAPLLFNTASGGLTNTSITTASSPDEYGAAIQVPVRTQICGYGLTFGAVASADAFEMRVFSDPFGSPSAIDTFTPDPDRINATSTSPMVHAPIPGLLTLEPGTWYGFTVRPTTANAINWTYMNSGSGFDVLKAGQPFSAIRMIGRTDNTGAFAETQTYHTPMLALHVCGHEDGTGGGGGSFDVVQRPVGSGLIG